MERTYSLPSGPRWTLAESNAYHSWYKSWPTHVFLGCSAAECPILALALVLPKTGGSGGVPWQNDPDQGAIHASMLLMGSTGYSEQKRIISFSSESYRSG